MGIKKDHRSKSGKPLSGGNDKQCRGIQKLPDDYQVEFFKGNLYKITTVSEPDLDKTVKTASESRRKGLMNPENDVTIIDMGTVCLYCGGSGKGPSKGFMSGGGRMASVCKRCGGSGYSNPKDPEDKPGR